MIKKYAAIAVLAIIAGQLAYIAWQERTIGKLRTEAAQTEAAHAQAIAERLAAQAKVYDEILRDERSRAESIDRQNRRLAAAARAHADSKDRLAASLRTYINGMLERAQGATAADPHPAGAHRAEASRDPAPP